MNKTDLINVVAANAGVSKKDAEAVIKATLDAITTAMTNGESVSFSASEPLRFVNVRNVQDTTPKQARRLRLPRAKHPYSSRASP